MDKNIQDKIKEVQSKINEMQDKLEELKRVAAEKDNPYFDRANEGACYYTIDPRGYVIKLTESGNSLDHALYAVANYSKDIKFLEKRAAEETLSRLIWREAEIANAGRKSKQNWRFAIAYDSKNKAVGYFSTIKSEGSPGESGFICQEDAQACIKNVVIPFVKAHPELGWELEEEEN